MPDATQELPLARLLKPASIAVVGGREAEATARNCERMGFAGPLWPVNPKRREMAGRPCLARIEDLSEPPDAVFIALPAEMTIEVVGKLASLGAGGAVCYASGFKEVGPEGADRQARLVAAAGAMPIIGPNCYGLLDYLDGVALWPDQHGGRRVDRGVAIVTQSGNMGINITMQRRGLRLAYLISLGNQARVGIEACVAALAADPRVSAIGLHIEGLGDVAAFERAAGVARARNLPLVALKTGRSETGRKIALTHTASLAGADALYDAFFRRLGVARVATLPEFLETLKLLDLGGPLAGRRLASLSCSGGEASLIADLAAGREVLFPDLVPDHRARVAAALGAGVEVSNPLDYHTYAWGDGAALESAFTAMLGGGFDLAMLILDYPRTDRCKEADWHITARAFAKAARETGTRGAVVASLPECLPEATALSLAEAGLTPLAGMSEALSAAEAAALVGTARPMPPLLGPRPPGAASVRSLDEAEAKALLEGAGIAVPAGRVARSVAEARAAFDALGGAVAVKALSRDIAHKSEVGGVVLGLDDGEAVAAAAERLLEVGGAVLVERMVEDGVAELIVGLDHDAQFGPYLLLGSGGVLVELLVDRRILLLPTSAKAVRQALLSLRLAPLLTGYRGARAGDLGAVVAAVMAIAALVEKGVPPILELDVNPLIVRPAGHGVAAADAWARLGQESS